MNIEILATSSSMLGTQLFGEYSRLYLHPRGYYHLPWSSRTDKTLNAWEGL